MKNLTWPVVVILLFAAQSFAGFNPGGVLTAEVVQNGPTEPAGPEYTDLDLWSFGMEQKIRVASFNIQVFGKAKSEKPGVMEVLAKTIARFDIVAIQEIRDKAGRAIPKLEAAVDALGADYHVFTGPRLGRSRSREQYAYFYNPETVTRGHYYTYSDLEDVFHREPLIAEFRSRTNLFSFVLITVHVDPDDARREIDSLPAVVEDARRHFPEEDDFVILGDLNADCDYYDEEKPSPLDVGYLWITGDNEDTNVAGSSCTYDRIITTEATRGKLTGESGVFRFDQEFDLGDLAPKKVSDHYPVWVEFFTFKGSY